MKSKTSARRTMIPSSIISRVLQDDPFEDVGHVLAAVRGALEVVVDVAPLERHERIVSGREHARDAPSIQSVRLVLDAVDLDAEPQEVVALLVVGEELDRALDDRRRVEHLL